MTRKLSTPKYYKVVRLFSDGVRGSVVVDREDPLFQQYVPGERIRVKNESEYGLFVFDDYSAALYFACAMRNNSQGANLEIWRVDVEGVRPLPKSEADNPNKFMVDALVLRECVRVVDKHTRRPANKMTTVYKVVRATGDGYYTSVSFHEGDVAYVRYRPGRWAYAPAPLRKLGYHLTVFPDLTSIQKWLGHPRWNPPRDWQVWRCDARGVHEPRLLSFWEEDVTAWVQAVQAVLRGDPVRIGEISSGRWVPGTLFARAVRLVERVPWDNPYIAWPDIEERCLFKR
jgi:hypothetical protein